MLELQTLSMLVALVALVAAWWNITNYRGALEYQTGRTVRLRAALVWTNEQLIRVHRSLQVERRKVKQLEELQGAADQHRDYVEQVMTYKGHGARHWYDEAAFWSFELAKWAQENAQVGIAPHEIKHPAEYDRRAG